MPFGGLADAIPREWWQALARQGDIEFLARRMANQLGKTNGIAALPLPPVPVPCLTATGLRPRCWAASIPAT